MISFSCLGQQKLQFKIDGLNDTTVFLARYFGEKLYYADTTISKNETVIFNKKVLVGGIYAVVCPNSKYFEFIVADEDVLMETDINDFNGKMKVIKSENNKIFYDYIKFLGSMKEKMISINPEKQSEKRVELDNLINFLEQCLDILCVGGRLAIISFHSLEDRIVKRYFRSKVVGQNIPSLIPILDKDIKRQMKLIINGEKAGSSELRVNPRARSAVLRVHVRLHF